MAAPQATSEGTVAPEGHAGLPQMNAGTFPGQVFWLVITFGALFIVLSRMTLPMIGGAIGARRNRIEGDLAQAEQSRKDASDALASYESALSAARGRALTLADENRKRTASEVEALKNSADAQAQTAMAAAEAKISATRQAALAHIRTAAGEAAADIVERLIGERLTPDEAAEAVGG